MIGGREMLPTQRLGAPRNHGKCRLTTMRDILREMGEQEKREQQAEQEKTEASNESLHTVGAVLTDGQTEGSSKLVIRMPPATIEPADRMRIRTRRTRKPSGRSDLSDKTASGSSCDQQHPPDQSAIYQHQRQNRMNSLAVEAGMTRLDQRRRSRRPSVCSTVSSSAISDIDVDSVSMRGDESSGDAVNDVRRLVAWTNNAEGMCFQPKLLIERGSTDFHNVMDQMKAEIKKKQRRQNFKKAINMSMMLNKIGEAKPKECQEHEEDSSSGSDVSDDETASKVKKPPEFRKMARGWKLLNMKVREEQMEKKKQETMGGWNFLSKTVTNLTNEEKARRDLYEKYLYKQNSWAEGLVNYPHFLLDKKGSDSAQSKCAHKKLRPKTAHASHTSSTSNCRSTTIHNHKGQQSVPGGTLLSRRPRSGHV